LNAPTEHLRDRYKDRLVKVKGQYSPSQQKNDRYFFLRLREENGKETTILAGGVRPV
jgi:hypothetical protein